MPFFTLVSAVTMALAVALSGGPAVPFAAAIAVSLAASTAAVLVDHLR